MTVSSISTLTQGRGQQYLLDQISEEVAHVEAELNIQMSSQVELVANVAKHTLRAGGKRLRPAFVALAAKATGHEFDVERTRRLGACMEMIHMATLIHDDVIDNSATRRGHPTASAVFGNTASILSGDALLAKAMVLLTKDDDLQIVRSVSAAVVDMAEGEVRELETRGEFFLEEAAHFEVLRLKTASFIEACCDVGALVAKSSPEVRACLKTYGFHIGMAFQIVDDLLDYRGDRSKTGKPIATDFREGQATLPLIFLRDKLSEAESQMVQGRFGSTVSDDELRMISDWMDTRGAFKNAEAVAQKHVDEALACLVDMPDTASRELLATVAEYVLRRQE